MWKKTLIISMILVLHLFVCYKIYTKYKNTTIDTTKTTIDAKQIKPIIKKEKPIGKLIIKKLNLEEYLYSINSKENNIEKHVTILKYSVEPNQENSIMFIAAHSGTGSLAYFKHLDKLALNDMVILEYKNNIYKYKVKNIWQDKKTGTINIPKAHTKQLILTTCSPNKEGYQLTINCLAI